MSQCRKSASGWRLDEDGRLLSPDGEWLARLVGGVLLFYDKKRREYVPFEISDWWELVKPDGAGEQDAPAAVKRVGAWGRGG